MPTRFALITLVLVSLLSAGCHRHISCADGTRSPSCTKSAPGCCAGHGGVAR